MKVNVARIVLFTVCWCCPIFGWAATIFGSEIVTWQLQTSVYTRHFDPSPEHNNHPHLIDIELWTENRWMYGLAIFDNSFDQPSQYLYAGHHWRLFGSEHVYVKVTAGLLHGYKDEYKNKIPLNDLGVAPAIVPSVGVSYKRVAAELQLLGTSAITLTAGLRF